jgi:hypothetical protein
MRYGEAPVNLGEFIVDLPEFMHYQYLPVFMGRRSGYSMAESIKLPKNLYCLYNMIRGTMFYTGDTYRYVYVTAKKGWATPDNPLNRPGWHCDGFGTDDMNFIWWSGPGTLFAVQDFHDISNDHEISIRQFSNQICVDQVKVYRDKQLFALNPYVVHSTPYIASPGCMRQFVKISLSNHRYNLEDNSHNYLFDYNWEMVKRDTIRNDPHKKQQDFS